MNFVREQLIDFFELPEEIIGDLPLLMLAGPGKLYLENHRGIAVYHREKVKIRINRGYLVIEGEKLEVEEIQQDNLQITGLIEKLLFDLV